MMKWTPIILVLFAFQGQAAPQSRLVVVPSIIPISSYASDVIAHGSNGLGLVNYYRMGDAAGSFSDRKAGNTATVTGGVTFQSLGLLPGDATKGALFDGATGYATLGSNTSWNFATTDSFTVEALIDPTNAKSVGNEQMLACKQLDSGTFQGWCFGLINVGGSLRLEAYATNNGTANQNYIVGSQSVSLNTAHHVSMSYASGVGSVSPYYSFQLEVDGVVDTGTVYTTQNLTGSIQSAASSTIGSRSGTSSFYQGYIQELAVYKATQLTGFSAQVFNHANLFQGHSPTAPNASVPSIILDTDLSTDIDDVGDVALLSQLAVNGEANIAGVINDASSDLPAVAGKIILNFKGATSPVYGAYKQSNLKGAGPYAASLISTFSAAYANGDQNSDSYPDATIAYRQILNSAANKSITIVMTGQWVPLYNLLQSGANCSGCPGGVTDAISSTGLQLVASKVKSVVAEAGIFSSSAYFKGLISYAGGAYQNGVGGGEFNLMYASTGSSAPQASGALATLLSNNVPVFFVGDEQGIQVFTGPPVGDNPATNPIKDAYNLFVSANPGNLNGAGQRPAWGQLSVLFAVRGFGPFGQSSPGRNFESYFLNGSMTISSGSGANTQIGPSSGSISNIALVPGNNVQATINALIAP